MTRRIWPEVRAGVTVLVAVAVWRELAPFPGDAAARRWAAVHPVLPFGFTNVSTLLSALATPGPAILTLVVAAWAAGRRWGRREAWGLMLAASAVLVAEGVQDAVGRGAVQTVATAYPSGHVVWAGAVFGLIALRARRHGVPELAWPALAVVALMGPERVLTGAHGISDVLGGYALGLAWAIAVDRWVGAPRGPRPAGGSGRGGAEAGVPGRTSTTGR